MIHMKPTLVRQGDVLLIPLTAMGADLEPTSYDPRGLVLAEGETSEHYPALFGSGAKLMRYRSTPSRVVDDGGEVRVIGGGSGGVDRHIPVQLASGRYKIRVQRQFSTGYVRRVVDQWHA